MSRAFIGSGAGSGPQYPNSSTGIIDALRAGHRWLVFTEQDNPIYEPIDLDLYVPGNNYLRLEGGGIAQNNWQRNFTGAPMLVATRPFYLDMTGITFQGMGNMAETSVRLGHVDICHIDRCAAYNAGVGMEFGAGVQAATSTMTRCEILGNGHGVIWRNAIDVHMEHNIIQTNTVAGVEMIGPPSGHESRRTRGLCTFDKNHLELNGPNGRYGLILNDVRACDVRRNYLYLSYVLLHSNTADCLVERNRLWESDIDNLAGTANTVRNNFRVV